MHINEWEDLKIIGEWCQNLRKNTWLTQTDVANDTKLTQKTVSAFENGRNNNMRLFIWYLNNCRPSSIDLSKLEERLRDVCEYTRNFKT